MLNFTIKIHFFYFFICVSKYLLYIGTIITKRYSPNRHKRHTHILLYSFSHCSKRYDKMNTTKNTSAKVNVKTTKLTTNELSEATKNAIEVKKLNLTFYQANGTKVETKFELNSEAKTSLLIGTAINELFTLQNNYRKANLKLFKSSDPVLFTVSSNEVELLNIGKCSRLITDKLKFNKTAKSMSIFAKRVNLAVTELSRNITLIDYSEVEKAILSIVD